MILSSSCFLRKSSNSKAKKKYLKGDGGFKLIVSYLRTNCSWRHAGSQISKLVLLFSWAILKFLRFPVSF